jgi:pilus assembly protein Flp/PilA
MLSIINAAVRFLQFRIQNEKGQALAEYGLILALIAVVCIAALFVLGWAIYDNLIAVETGLEGAVPGGGETAE